MDFSKMQGEHPWKGLFGRSFALPIVAAILVVFLLLGTVRVGHLSGEEVGVMLNKLNGETRVVAASGAHIYNGITHEFFTLDKTLQTLEMSVETSSPTREEQGSSYLDFRKSAKSSARLDHLKIKTIDGSDVYVDLKVQYRINPEEADIVLKSSGPANAYKIKWARDYTRSICRNFLGELTTEDFYDSGKRQEKVKKALDMARKQLAPYGIVIDSIIIPTKPTFYKEYAEKIKEKKLADQAVLEEKSKAQAAKQRQQTEIVIESNKKNVAVEEFRGKMEQLVVKAEAEAEQTRKGADAYFDRVTIGAEAELYSAKKRAEAVLATKKSQARGIQAMKEALEGEGGRNMVKLEYARRLKDIVITGQPFTRDAHSSRFEYISPAARAAEGAKK